MRGVCSEEVCASGDDVQVRFSGVGWRSDCGAETGSFGPSDRGRRSLAEPRASEQSGEEIML